MAVKKMSVLEKQCTEMSWKTMYE